MREILKSGRAAIAGLLVLLSAGSAQAALVNFSLTGYVDGSAGSPFGLDVGETITASGTFDDSTMGVSPFTVYFDMASGNMLTIFAGSLTLNETQDDNYASGGSPKLEFDSGGALIGFGFNVGFMDGSTFDSGVLAWITNDADFNFATGYWDANSFTMTPVPVPAAVWLFGSGLLGLVGIARARKT
jgi:hypothetical protein